MALILPTADQTFTGDESSRRRSTFYVPLSTEDLTQVEDDNNQNVSGFSYDWSLNDSMTDGSDILREKSQYASDDSTRLKRYGIVLNGSVNIDDSNLEVHANHRRTKAKAIMSSTPIKETVKCTEILSEPQPVVTVTIGSAVREKSKTLPVKDSQTAAAAATFPPKHSFLLKSTPKISTSINYTCLSDSYDQPKPKKSLSFIRRTHSTKLSRNNSLLKSLTSRCVEHSNESLPVNVYDLSVERLELYLKAENCDDLMKELFLREPLDISSEGSDKNNHHKEHAEDDDGQSGKRTQNFSRFRVRFDKDGW
jgi:hypothetical protein